MGLCGISTVGLLRSTCGDLDQSSCAAGFGRRSHFRSDPLRMHMHTPNVCMSHRQEGQPQDSVVSLKQ